MTETVLATELQYIDPRSNSDKFYRVFVHGTEILTQYGRNGTFGTFTPRKNFASGDAAQKAADKAIAGKVGKGYNPVASGVLTFQTIPTDSDLDQAAARLDATGTGIAMPQLREQSAVVAAANGAQPVDPAAHQRVLDAVAQLRLPARPITPSTLPTRPMLAEVVAPAALESVLNSDAWVSQPKLDGDRVVVEVVDGVVAVLNRAGQPKVKNVGDGHLSPFRALSDGRWVFDGEVVGRKLWLFDMPAAGPFHDEASPFTQRYATLAATLAALGITGEHEHIGLVPTTIGSDAKRFLLEAAARAGKEGVMFRAAAASYQPGRRSQDLLKHKFLHDADCEVIALDPVKESVTLAVRDHEGAVRVVGAASTIGKGSIAVGDVVEVRYLYVVNAEHPRMFQPRIMRRRTGEKSALECSIDQFAHAVTDKSVD